MNLLWAIIGAALCALAFYLDPMAASCAAVGALILLLAYLNTTVGPILKLAIEAARAFTYRKDNCVEAIQALSIAIVRWRQI